jgi:hypothetical protein
MAKKTRQRVHVPAAVAAAFKLAELDGVEHVDTKPRGRGFIHVLEMGVKAARKALDLLEAHGATNQAPYKAVVSTRERLRQVLAD